MECVRETLALALEELDGNLTEEQRPEFWEPLWERYVESKLDYKSAEEALQSKRRTARNAAKTRGSGLGTTAGVVRRRGLHLGTSDPGSQRSRLGTGWTGSTKRFSRRVRKGISNRSLRYQHYRAKSGLSRWKDQHQLQ